MSPIPPQIYGFLGLFLISGTVAFTLATVNQIFILSDRFRDRK